MDKDFNIYKIVNTTNNKIYIGLTTQPIQKRFDLHCWKAASGSNYPLHEAIREFGKDSFSITTIETTHDTIVARELEKAFIKLFNSQDKSIGYNTTAGGEYFEVTERILNGLKNKWEAEGVYKPIINELCYTLTYIKIYQRCLYKFLRWTWFLSFIPSCCIHFEMGRVKY